MTKHLKRHLSILLAALIVMSVLATFPLTVGAASTGSTAWVFSTSDNAVYDLSGKYAKNSEGTTVSLGNDSSFDVTEEREIYLGNVMVAVFSDPEDYYYIDSFAESVYVTGLGTNDNPFVFQPNYLYGKNDAENVKDGPAIAIGESNEAHISGGVNTVAIAIPGDGFVGMSRLVTKGDTAQFLPYSHTFTATGGGKDSKCLGVSPTNYGKNYSSGVAQGGDGDVHDFLYSNTLYYLGKNSDSVQLFCEVPSLRHSFEGSASETYTVTWSNYDGSLLDIETYTEGESPIYKGATPTKPRNAQYKFQFNGWSPVISNVTGDLTYTAQFNQIELSPEETQVKVSAWIFSTKSNKEYPELEGKCFKYNDNEAISFPVGGGAFTVENNRILLCGEVVADIDTSKAYQTYADTVYVTGTGLQDDPLIFYPNYIYRKTDKVNVKDGALVAIGSENWKQGDNATAKPGDGFKGTSKMRVGSASDVQFLPGLDYYHATATRGYLGVGATTYGNKYSLSTAKPFTFINGSNTLYYYGVNNSDDHAYLFSESRPPMRSNFDGTEWTTHTVTWKNHDGTVLDMESYYVGVNAEYKGDTPTKAASGSTTYSFKGWNDGTTSYAADDELPAVTQDLVMTAEFTKDIGLFAGYTLTLNGDIGLNFWLNVSEDEVTQGEGTTVEFEWNVKGHTEPKTANAKLTAAAGGYKIVDGHKYYKATCWVAAAEMAYNIRATAFINGEVQSETNTYSVKSYGMDVLNSPAGTFDKQDLLTDLVKKMLDYGAKAQTLFDRADVPLANSGLVDNLAYTMSQTDNDKSINENITYTRSDMRDGTEAGLGLKYLGTSIIYLSKTSLRHYYQVVDKDLFNNVKDSVGGEFVYGVNGDAIYFEKQDIAAADIDTIQTFTIGGKSFNFSVLDYIKLVLNSDLSDNDKKLAMATYWYNKAADAYFTS